MPKYYVYKKDSGEVVHVHETYDGTSGLSLPCDNEEIFEMIDDSIDKKNLEILSVEAESQQARDIIRVNPKTRELVQK